ncbi:MAG TPA: hypothetical protein VH572_07930 [Gaiella sp.]|jgi:hypothetical protein
MRFSRRRNDLERRLRDERPAPSDDLIQTLSHRMTPVRVPAPRRTPRLALSVAFTVLFVLAFAMTGGIGYAHSKGRDGASAVRHLFNWNEYRWTSQSSSRSQDNRRRGDDDDRRGKGGGGHHDDDDDDDDDDDPDDDQYDDKVIICHKPFKRHGGITIRVSQRALQRHLAHGDRLGKCHRRRHDDDDDRKRRHHDDD